MILRPGLELLSEEIGEGPPVRRHAYYRIKLEEWLAQGQPVRWPQRWDFDDIHRLEENGRVSFTEVRVDRVSLPAGLFHGIQGMNVGGTRLLRIAAHLAYGTRGVPDVIPPNSGLTVKLSVLGERPAAAAE